MQNVADLQKVADDASRGISPEQLVGRWKHGPSFLNLSEEDMTPLNYTKEHPRDLYTYRFWQNMEREYVIH